ATSTQAFTGSGAYSVAADGAIVFDGSPGAMAGDAEMFFFTTGSAASSEVGMTICVRIGATYDHNHLAGPYSLHGQGHVLGAAPSLPRTVTDIGDMELTATSSTTGSWTVSGDTVDGNSLGIVAGQLTGAGTSSLASNGVMTLTDPAGLTEFAFSASGDYAVGRVLENNTNLFFMMRGCPENGDYGQATAGAGGIEPELGMRGFPTVGNAAWSWAIIEGIGGAGALLPIGFAASPIGIPLSGGQLWLDPGQIVATNLIVLGGTPGAAGAGSADIALPIPNQASVAGVDLFTQAFILDNAAPGGVSMSRGFFIEICR
ncbi:MAG: hypothetical protein P8N50_13130, partial [Actinomycetota bacterium]|nr:hypothetical protein [Actinomycetota bacterium]